jgi:uncharacterized OB-fold protein
MTAETRDWTEGAEAVLYEACPDCGHRTYLRRGFCPACGSDAVELRRSGGRGAVHATTTVVRAPSPAWKEIAPYPIVLVDLDEGVRMLAHAEAGLGIGDRVEIGWQHLDGRVLPRARPESSSKDPA